ncbi:MAG: hypothetical protein MMC33_001846 [Icmadophila ericetorum]|nr:hypothetical protein [Icmadophila ericetorum]
MIHRRLDLAYTLQIWILPRASAVIGLAGDIENQVGLDASHREICRFDPSILTDKDNYEKVQGNLEEFYKGALEKQGEIFPNPPAEEREISQPPLQSNDINQYWTVRRTVNSLFTGREKNLNIIKDALQPNKENSIFREQKRFVITGQGGHGKSEICLKIANAMRQDSELNATSDFIAIAKTIGFSAESVDEVRQLLANRIESWLLILDNADESKIDYARYIPSGARGSIIMTSRVPESQQYNTVGWEALTGLSDEESIELLLKAARIPPESWPTHKTDAKTVIETLGSHTLALIQAGAYIANRCCFLKDYPSEYRQQQKRLLQYAPKQARSRYGNVYATFEVFPRGLESSTEDVASDALRLLDLLSILHHQDVPLQVFQDAWVNSRHVDEDTDKKSSNSLRILTKSHASWLPDFIQTQEDRCDTFRLKDTIDLLTSLALTTADHRFVSMHCLHMLGLRSDNIPISKLRHGAVRDPYSLSHFMEARRG